MTSNGHLEHIKHKHIGVLALCLIFFSMGSLGILFGQNKNVSTDNQQWLQYYNQTKLNSKWVLFYDVGYRWNGGFQKRSQYIIRTAIGYSINPSVCVSSGFAHLGFYAVKKVEFRPYQELAIKNNFNTIEINHRYRVEERFFNTVNNGEIQYPNTFNFRFRYSLMVKIPLFKLSNKKNSSILLLNVGDEIFINASNNIEHKLFDQNRFMISPSLQLNDQLTVSLTWNSQFASTLSQTTYKYTHIIWLQVKHQLNLKDNSHNG